MAYLILAFVLFMMGAALILTSKMMVNIDPSTGSLVSMPAYSVPAVLLAMLIGMVALLILTFGAYFNGDKETHGILVGFVATLVIGLILLVLAVVSTYGGAPHLFAKTPVKVSIFLDGDFSLPCYISALYLLVGGILLFFKKGNFKLVGLAYILVALMFVFFARAIQTICSVDVNLNPAGILDAQTPLVVAGVFALVAGLIAVYIGIAKTNVIKAPLV